MAGNYEIRDLYQGGYSSFEPLYSTVGYSMSAKGLGMSTDARTANILKEVSENISAGAKAVELTQVSSEVFESVPDEQLDEVRRLSKLTGVDVSVHAPVVEPSGITQQGYSDAARRAVERQMLLAVERSRKIDPEGNIPVTFHSSAGIPGEIKEKGKEEEMGLLINKLSWQLRPVEIKKRHWPEDDKKSDVYTEAKRASEDFWSESIRSMEYYADYGSRLTKDTAVQKLLRKEIGDIEPEMIKEAESKYRTGAAMLNDAYRQLTKLFDVAYDNVSNPEDKKLLEKFMEEVKKEAEMIKKDPMSSTSIMKRMEIIEKGKEIFEKLSSPPQIFVPLRDFAEEKTTTTFGNVAFEAYKKFKDSAPTVVIENPPAGGAFSTGEELKKIVEKSREHFVKRAVEEGISESEAKKLAEKFIGATWDVGHINMLRRYGYESEDIIKETEKIAPLVKHVHLSDNFGFEHTELPMGMGNVPVKEMMEKLGKEGFEGRKIIEALSWWQHFSPGGKHNPPLAPTLKAFGVPMYSTGVGPYWNQAVGLHQDYFGGYGKMLPQMNYETFGAGFSNLPAELGGQRFGGEGSRMSGRPME